MLCTRDPELELPIKLLETANMIVSRMAMMITANTLEVKNRFIHIPP